MSQGYLSELERGHKLLTPGVAQRLAQALGMPANQLMIDELLASLNRVAQKGQIDLRPLLTEADRLTEILPAGEIGDEIIMALARILRERQKLTN